MYFILILNMKENVYIFNNVKCLLLLEVCNIELRLNTPEMKSADFSHVIFHLLIA